MDEKGVLTVSNNNNMYCIERLKKISTHWTVTKKRWFASLRVSYWNLEKCSMQQEL